LTTFILHVSDEQAMAQLRHHVTALVKVPVFEAWTGYLWQAGQSTMLVRRTRGAGGLDVLAIDLDVDSWTRRVHSTLGARSGSGPSLVERTGHGHRPQNDHAVKIGP
jgi:hypothetical protein